MINICKKKFGIKVEVEFSAAHHIRGYDGECSRPHGHNFKVEVEATTPHLNEIGLSFDFKHLKKIIKELVARFDHQNLNEIEPFISKVNPTAETLAQYFFDEIELKMKVIQDLGKIELKKVVIWENERSSASYGYSD